LVVAAFVFLAFTSDSKAQGHEHHVLAVQSVTDRPIGFNADRLVERIRLYLADLGREVSVVWGPQAEADFVLELEWFSPELTPFRATLHQIGTGPEREQSFVVEQTDDWDAFERLLALKLRSELRARLEAAPERPPEPPPPPPEPPPPPALGLSVFPQLEFGGGAVYRHGGDLVPEATVAGWIGEREIGAGTRLSMTLPKTSTEAASDTEIFDNSVVAFLRFQAIGSGGFALFGELDGGVFSTRLSSERLGAKRDTWLVSPIFSAKLLAGYRISSAAIILGGPFVSVLPSRDRVFAAGESVYDSGHIRPGIQLSLGLEL
jgi:hypothetical protein